MKIVYEFEVTEEDICLGDRNEARSCPIARAATRTFGDCLATVGRETMGIMPGEHNLIYRMTARLCEWVNDFDNELEVKPIKIGLTRALEAVILENK